MNIARIKGLSDKELLKLFDELEIKLHNPDIQLERWEFDTWLVLLNEARRRRLIPRRYEIKDIEILTYEFNKTWLKPGRVLRVVFNDDPLRPYILIYPSVDRLIAKLSHDNEFIDNPVIVKKHELIIDLLKSQK